MAEVLGSFIIAIGVIGAVLVFLSKKECKEDPNIEDMIKKIDKLSDKEVAIIKAKVDKLC